MTKKEFSVNRPKNGSIEFSVHHRANSFEMPVDAAESFAKLILECTESDEV